ncbi:hypothetical protein FJV76_20145 [Mesorhizobium sp. WSM4303]|uniref:hypothetical protein n=1 Tax=unclassified Mesorhizobium TaxID=325217 RepID=UPI00115ED0A7|nr:MULTISPECIES: hypothetical protein [unclassified Mesorhizobium]TRC94499.1 hypothetical protein FJV77_18415 [Mesorhizobium sp. WSM4306]TRD01934.1 hypothetical protein FJV76_20145 [Mesorhizobium sp. WSM4303]
MKLITFTSIQSNARQGAKEEHMAARQGAHAIEAGFPALSPPARSSTAGLSRSQDLDYAVIPGRGQRTIMLSRVILCYAI